MNVTNDGPRLRSTDYWQTPHAERGLLYLTINAGAFRLLVPPAAAGNLDDWRTASRAAVHIAGATLVGLVHIVFDDDSSDPAYVTLDLRQCDRSLPHDNIGRWSSLDIYGPGDGPKDVTLLLSMPALIRQATREPDPSAIPEVGTA